MSQCDTDEPPAKVDGVYMSTLCAASAPLSRFGSRNSVTLRPTRLDLSNMPSAWVTRTDGIVTPEPLPPMPPGGHPAALSATTTAMAPAFCAYRTFVTKPQPPPRSISAMLPLMAAPLTRGSQAFVTDGN